MAKLPRDLSGGRLRKILEGVGFAFRRQKGSHMVLRREQPAAVVVVPDHPVLKPGTLRSILKMANLSVEDLLERMNETGPRSD
jgi:predicted RNA binding protein YcfA (HicA-like mRNA interferase family)